MKKPENEIIYDAPVDAVDNFAKEFDGIDDQVAQNGIQESWNSGLNEENIVERRAEDVKNRTDSQYDDEEGVPQVSDHHEQLLNIAV